MDIIVPTVYLIEKKSTNCKLEYDQYGVDFKSVFERFIIIEHSYHLLQGHNELFNNSNPLLMITKKR